MHGAPFLVVAEVCLLIAKRCMAWAMPFLGVAALACLVRRMDQIIDRLFPHWEWEKRLGWLNIRAQRRADLVLRWIGYFIYAVLAVALLGIVWGAEALATLDRWDDPSVMADLALRVPVLLACLGLWLVYFGCELIPKLRDQSEREGLRKFRAEQRELEEERERNPVSRIKSPLYKPRFGLSIESDRMRPRR